MDDNKTETKTCLRRWFISYEGGKTKQSEAQRRGTEIHKELEQDLRKHAKPIPNYSL